MFFAAGPLEQAIVAKSMGWETPKEREMMVGFGSLDRVLDTLEAHLSAGDWVCGERFTMADVYLGSQVDWGLAFGTCPRARPSKPMPRASANAKATRSPRPSTTG